MGGFVLCLLGLALQTMAFALAPIPVVQSIFNAGIVLLILFSRVRLGERLHKNEWLGLVVVVVSLISMSASLSRSPSTVGLSGSGAKVLLAAIPTIVVVMLVARAIQRGHTKSGFMYGVAAGLLYGGAALGTKGASTLVVQHGLVNSVPFILGSVYPYVFIVLSVFGMMMYQTGLQRFRIAVVGSMSDVVCSTYLVAVGTVVFSEVLPKDPWILLLRSVGFVGVLVGSVIVALGSGSNSAISVPPTESDIGLGTVLLAEAEAAIGHPLGGTLGSSTDEP
jgi:drug/metabolite transporter (DMT)-like permease